MNYLSPYNFPIFRQVEFPNAQRRYEESKKKRERYCQFVWNGRVGTSNGMWRNHFGLKLKHIWRVEMRLNLTWPQRFSRVMSRELRHDKKFYFSKWLQNFQFSYREAWKGVSGNVQHIKNEICWNLLSARHSIYYS